mmetsp:Transcript_96665/g.288661  ORF Transcript_96665/g.288661 Transcript_96665/m.288661 type:complete len:210 (+) Transcript_96665:65-694(+)
MCLELVRRLRFRSSSRASSVALWQFILTRAGTQRTSSRCSLPSSASAIRFCAPSMTRLSRSNRAGQGLRQSARMAGARRGRRQQAPGALVGLAHLQGRLDMQPATIGRKGPRRARGKKRQGLPPLTMQDRHGPPGLHGTERRTRSVPGTRASWRYFAGCASFWRRQLARRGITSFQRYSRRNCDRPCRSGWWKATGRRSQQAVLRATSS